ncbi:MAG: hypothetical protein ABI361_11070 [Nitrososphaera sp.]|jgi:hypothetical protein
MSGSEGVSGADPDYPEESLEEETVVIEHKRSPSESVSPSDIIVDADSADVITYKREVSQPAEETVSAKAHQAGESLKELASAVGTAAKEKLKETTNKVIENRDAMRPDNIDAKRDARDISRLSPYAENLAASFEQTMAVIQTQDYADQERMLIGYRTLLEEQLRVIEARQRMAKRLKSV